MRKFVGRSYLSLVVPVFNEEKRISKGLLSIIKYLKNQQYSWEIVLVDDGSTDKTLEFAENLLKNVKNKLIISYKPNLGKGAAVKKGVLQANGKYIVFCDIDLSVPISKLSNMLFFLNKNEIVIGVRRSSKSKIIIHQPKIREFLGHIFTKLTQNIIGSSICDVTCGFKGFQNQAAQKIFHKSKINRWAYDAEILYLAKKFKYQIYQMPVVWKHDKGSKVKVLGDGVRALWDLIRIKCQMINY